MAPHGFVTSEEKTSNLLTLIVDKKGIFGEELAQKIHESIPTVLVTAKETLSTEHVLVIPYTKTIPEIPEGNYSHIFFIWDGRSETLHVLEPLLEKAAADNAQFLFITDYHCLTPKLGVYIHQQYAKASVFLTGDIFGASAYRSIVTMFFDEAIQHKTIHLENVGLRHIYPILFSDVVEQIVSVGFGKRGGKVFLCLQQYGMTELSLAHVLQKVDPLLKIDFVKESIEKSDLKEHFPLAENGEYLFDINYPTARKLQETYTDLVAGQKQETYVDTNHLFFSPFTQVQEKKEVNKKKKRWFVGIGTMLLLLISPVLFTLFYAGLGGVVLYAASTSIRAGNYKQAAEFSQTSENLFSVALSANAIGQQEARYIFLGKFVSQFTNLLEEGNLLASLLSDGAKAAGDFSMVARGISPSPQADFLSGVNTVKNALVTMENSPAIGTIIGIPFATISQAMQPLGSILDISSTLFGFSAQKTYLVLFQNNMELRPGGGFIGSYALVTLQQGKITNFTVHDVYDADGQLKGHIEPPYVVRRYIPEQHWYLRDSNFDVDFSQDAANAAFFLKTETGEQVDGVVGIDLTFVKDMLSGIGPVFVPEYNQTVTESNFFLLTESHAEKNSFAGSTQKKDFIRSLLTAMQNKINSSHGFSPKAIIPLFMALKSKDVVFGFSDPLIQDVFTVSGLSGSLWDGRKADPGVVNDITGISEANIGVNKANYFVTRNVNQTVYITKTGNISGTVSITYTNASQPGQWPGGDYKNYLRVILPQGANLSSISLDGVDQHIIPAITDASIYEAKGFVAPQGLEVDSAVEAGKQIFGFVVTIPSQKTKNVTINYTLTQKIDMGRPTITYSGWLFKQPGVEEYPYTFSLTVPDGFSLLQKPGWINGNGSNISFSKQLNEDTPFSLIFTQK